MRHVLLPVFCMLAAVSSLASGEDLPTAAEAKLTAAELQKALGLKAWRVEIPASYGKHPVVRLQQSGDEGRTFPTDINVFFEEGAKRDLLITLREEGEFYLFSLEGGSSAKIPKRFAEEAIKSHPGGWTTSSAEPKADAKEILLWEAKYQSKKGPAEASSAANLETVHASWRLSVLPDPDSVAKAK